MLLLASGLAAGRSRFHEHGGLFMLRECLHDYMVRCVPMVFHTWRLSAISLHVRGEAHLHCVHPLSATCCSALRPTYPHAPCGLCGPTPRKPLLAGLYPPLCTAVRVAAGVPVQPANVPHRGLGRDCVRAVNHALPGLHLAHRRFAVAAHCCSHVRAGRGGVGASMHTSGH
jgi:hypothetical protein